ncbi:hypothetical protein OAL45_00845 [bacterium]|nr:hypothetical protein [bacterium]MDC0317983.1 hypothetical protein [bacterium]
MYNFSHSLPQDFSGNFIPDVNVTIDKTQVSMEEIFTAVEILFDASLIERGGSGIGFIDSP